MTAHPILRALRTRPLASRGKPHILVACQPKSGSTFLSTAIAGLPGFRRVGLAPGYHRREQELAEERLRRYRRQAYVAQHHVRFSLPTEKLITRYGLTTVVLVRNLFDAVISYRDAIRNDDPAGPAAFFETEHRSLPDQELDAAITRLAIPWYVNFYMSWRDAPNVHIVRYKEMIASPADTVQRIVRAAGLAVDELAIEEAISATRTENVRFNVGVVGRGGSLSDDLKREIVAMLDYYPSAARDPYVRDMKEGLS
jgi:hypothetical protein